MIMVGGDDNNNYEKDEYDDVDEHEDVLNINNDDDSGDADSYK